MTTNNNNILVTGFGPFTGHSVNASWEAVKLLPKEINGFNIITEEIEVSYDFVEKTVPELWKKYQPKLVIHVGVSGLADRITIETCARRTGYSKIDCKEKCHPTGNACNSDEGEDCIFGTIDLHKILAHINTAVTVKATSSTDAGRFLCEFIYYVSLNIDKSRTMFVHVPPLGKPYNSKELAAGLHEIIKCAIQQTCSCQNSI